jgi:hypothetical protein
MIPQGTSLIDTSYFTNLTAQVNAIQGGNSCSDLQDMVTKAAASIEAELAAIRAQIAALLPVTTGPSASLGSIVAWINSFIAPLQVAYANFIATEAAILSAVSSLESAIVAAAGRMTSCSITIPPMT